MRRNWANALRGIALFFCVFQSILTSYVWLQSDVVHNVETDARVLIFIAMLAALSVWLVVCINQSGVGDE
jgi:preprotein translocase subunit SecY